MLFSHRRLLEWNASSEHKHKNRSSLAETFRRMWFAPALAAVGLIGIGMLRPASLGIAAPILLIWFASPAVAWWISRPLARLAVSLSCDQTYLLRIIILLTCPLL